MIPLTLDEARRRVAPDAEGRFGSNTAAAIAIGVVGLASVLAVMIPGPQNDAKRFVWYRFLDKPKATPPDPVFGLAWPVLEVLLAYAGWRLLKTRRSSRRDTALALLAFNVSQIPGYQALFFGLRSIAGGLMSAALLATGAWAFAASAWSVDRRAAIAGLPLAGWTSFATYLMVGLRRRN
jgi:tryptophan-rich sensory protein